MVSIALGMIFLIGAFANRIAFLGPEGTQLVAGVGFVLVAWGVIWTFVINRPSRTPSESGSV